MKTFHWGMNNIITGSQFSWDDSNVHWGEPGYYLEPGDAGFVPYPGQVTSPEEKAFDIGALVATGHSATDIFECDIMPEFGDDFSASPGLDAELHDNTMDSAVSEATGIPADKCAAVLSAYLDQLLMCAAGSRLALGIYELLSICPSAGGSAGAGADGFQRPAGV